MGQRLKARIVELRGKLKAIKSDMENAKHTSNQALMIKWKGYQADLESLSAADCPECGEPAINSIDVPIIDDEMEKAQISSWNI